MSSTLVQILSKHYGNIEKQVKEAFKPKKSSEQATRQRIAS